MFLITQLDTYKSTEKLHAITDKTCRVCRGAVRHTTHCTDRAQSEWWLVWTHVLHATMLRTYSACVH